MHDINVDICLQIFSQLTGSYLSDEWFFIQFNYIHFYETHNHHNNQYIFPAARNLAMLTHFATLKADVDGKPQI